MKLAILGSSPIALEAALRFHLHGAALTWFNPHEGEMESFFQKTLSPESYISETGLAFLKELGKNYSAGTEFNFENWKQNYFLPLCTFIQSEQKIRPHEVVSITKRFLAPGEIPQGKSRFLDLFRVIFQVNPEEFIKEQKERNPETYARLSAEFVDSLQTNLEMYEDFDLVLDLRRPLKPLSLSVTGRALGEGRVAKEHVKYGYDAISEALKLNQDPQDVREVALIGSTALAAEVLTSLSDWLKDQRSRLFLISEETWPFEEFLKHAGDSSAHKLNELVAFMEAEFQAEVNTFHQKLREWQALDDFVQVKMPKPVEPIPRLVFFSGHNATAVDQLIDKRRLFLTLEKPEFRDGNRQPENNTLDLKTIGVDRILVANKLSRAKIEMELASNEVGFFEFDVTSPNLKKAWGHDLEKLKGIEHEIFKLFSPADSH